MAAADCEYQSVAVDDPAIAASPSGDEDLHDSIVLPVSRFPHVATDEEHEQVREEQSAEDPARRGNEYPEDWLVGIFYFIMGALLLASVNAFNSSRFARFFPPELYLQSLSVSGLRVTDSSLDADFTADFFLYNNNWGSSVLFDDVEVSVVYNDDTVLGTAKSGQGFGLGPMSSREAEMKLDRSGKIEARGPVVGPQVLKKIMHEVETDRVLSLGLKFKMAAAYHYGKNGEKKRSAEILGECVGTNVEVDPATGVGSLRFNFGMECSVVAMFEDEEGTQL